MLTAGSRRFQGGDVVVDECVVTIPVILLNEWTSSLD
jgi:hypothetical protein